MSNKGNKRLIIRDNRGAVLFLALGIMIVLLSLALMFAGLCSSRLTITHNQRDAIKARCIAESGIAHALGELADNPGYGSGIGETAFGGGTYSVDINQLGSDEIALTSIGAYGRASYRTRVLVDVPPASGTVYAWALRAGETGGIWYDSSCAHDDAGGQNNDYAVILYGQPDTQSLGHFRFEKVPYEITKVEILMRYRISQMLVKGHLKIRWRRQSDDKKCPRHDVTAATINQAMSTGGVGLIAVDLTSEPPPGGWTWDVFTADPSFQIDVKQEEFQFADRIYVDCVGFRITW